MAECNPSNFPMEPRNKLNIDKGGKLVDATEYRKMIGCLMYLLHTRHDLSYSVGLASRFMDKQTVMHAGEVKQTMRYLKGTTEFGLIYVPGGGLGVLVGYTNSDHGADQVERTSTGGMVVYLGENLVSWCS
jgi:hypothetical protein